MSNAIKASSNAYTKGGNTDEDKIDLSETLIEADGTTSKNTKSYSDPIESAYGYVTFPEKKSREEQLEAAKGGRKARLEGKFAKQDVRQGQRDERAEARYGAQKTKQDVKLSAWKTKRGIKDKASEDVSSQEDFGKGIGVKQLKSIPDDNVPDFMKSDSDLFQQQKMKGIAQDLNKPTVGYKYSPQISGIGEIEIKKKK